MERRPSSRCTDQLSSPARRPCRRPPPAAMRDRSAPRAANWGPGRAGGGRQGSAPAGPPCRGLPAPGTPWRWRPPARHCRLPGRVALLRSPPGYPAARCCCPARPLWRTRTAGANDPGCCAPAPSSRCAQQACCAVAPWGRQCGTSLLAGRGEMRRPFGAAPQRLPRPMRRRAPVAPGPARPRRAVREPKA